MTLPVSTEGLLLPQSRDARRLLSRQVRWSWKVREAASLAKISQLWTKTNSNIRKHYWVKVWNKKLLRKETKIYVASRVSTTMEAKRSSLMCWEMSLARWRTREMVSKDWMPWKHMKEIKILRPPHNDQDFLSSLWLPQLEGRKFICKVIWRTQFQSLKNQKYIWTKCSNW